MVPIATLIVLEILLSWLALKSRPFRRLLNRPARDHHPPAGKLDIQKLRQMRLTTDEVVETLRKQNVASVADVKYGVIEPDGSLTVVLPSGPAAGHGRDARPDAQGRRACRSLSISDGKLVRALAAAAAPRPAGYSRNRLDNQSLALSDVFLMTLDDCGNTFLQRKEGR